MMFSITRMIARIDSAPDHDTYWGIPRRNPAGMPETAVGNDPALLRLYSETQYISDGN